MICSFAAKCSGCSFWAGSYEEQVQLKTTNLQSWAQELGYQGEVHCHNVGPMGLRDRADLQWRRGEGWGFLTKDFNSIALIDKCPLFSEELQSLFQWWRQFKLKAPKASVRLRVAENGEWGVWLDMPNVEIKDLLEEDDLLTEWVAKAHVEIGQRFKVLKKINEHWKLTDPIRKPWFSTTTLDDTKIDLLTSIGSFTQVGRQVNKKLVKLVVSLAKNHSNLPVIELGAGSGNFTLAFAAEGFMVIALEQSEEALEGLKQSLQNLPALASKIHFQIGNFQKYAWGDWAKEPSILLLDPPRSGIGESLIKQIPLGQYPVIVYVACGVEAWRKDGERLRQLNYELKHLDWVDQFPNTTHYEIVSVWSLVKS